MVEFSNIKCWYNSVLSPNEILVASYQNGKLYGREVPLRLAWTLRSGRVRPLPSDKPMPTLLVTRNLLRE